MGSRSAGGKTDRWNSQRERALNGYENRPSLVGTTTSSGVSFEGIANRAQHLDDAVVAIMAAWADFVYGPRPTSEQAGKNSAPPSDRLDAVAGSLDSSISRLVELTEHIRERI